MPIGQWTNEKTLGSSRCDGISLDTIRLSFYDAFQNNSFVEISIESIELLSTIGLLDFCTIAIVICLSFRLSYERYKKLFDDGFRILYTFKLSIYAAVQTFKTCENIKITKTKRICFTLFMILIF